MGVPSLNDLAVDGTLNTTNQPRPLLERNYMCGSISIENISFSRNCDIKTTNAKSITDDSFGVKFISKNSDTLEIVEHILFNSPIIIHCYGFHFRSTDLVDKPCVNLLTT